MEKAEKGLSKGQRDAALPHEEEAKKELEEAYKKLQDFEKELTGEYVGIGIGGSAGHEPRM